MYIRESTIKDAGLGLFAARDFQNGDMIGKCWGSFVDLANLQGEQNQSVYILTTDFPTTAGRGAPVSMDAGRAPQSSEQQQQLFGRVLVDTSCWSWPGACISMANTATPGDRITTNAEVYEEGNMHATRFIPALADGCRHPARSEILWPYRDKGVGEKLAHISLRRA